MIVWFILGLLIGILIFLSPILLGRFLKFSWRTRLSNIFFDMSMRLFGRLIMCSRRHGGIIQYSSSYDEAKGAERIYFGKNEAYFDDAFSSMHFLFNRPTAFVHEAVSCIYDPRLAQIGQSIQEVVRAGKHEKEFSDKDGNSFTAFCGYTFVPKRLEILDLKAALSLVPGGADPLLASTTRKFIQFSQSGYKSVPLTELGLGLIFFIAGYGLSALTVYYLDKNPIPPGIEVNLPLWMVGLL